MIRSVAFAGALLLAVATGSARAASPAQQAVAQELFEEGKRLVAAGQDAEGCRKFEESDRIDPAIGTEFRLGDCYELTGRIASAWSEFLDVAAAARAQGQGAREQVARRRAAAIVPRLPRLRVEVERPVAGLVVTRNGEPMTQEQWALALPVDPGGYRIRAAAPGYRSFTTRALVEEEGQTVAVRVPELAAGTDEQPADSRTIRRRAALGLGVVGGASLIAGAIAGVYATVKKGQADAFCPQPDACFQQGLDLRAAARPAATAATVGISVGLGAAAGAAVLWLTARSGAASGAKSGVSLLFAPQIGPGAAGFGLRGAFW